MTDAAAGTGKRRSPLRLALRVALVVVAAYAAFAIYLATRPVVIAFDPVQKFRASLPKAVKPDDAAWPGYRDALVAMGYRGSKQMNETVSKALGAKPGDEGWSIVRPWIDANQAAVASSRQAAKRPVFGFPLGEPYAGADAEFFKDSPDPGFLNLDGRNREHFPMFAMSLPHLSPARAVSLALMSDLFRAVESGDGERATADTEALIALSIQVPESRLLIADLVGMAIRRQAVTAVTAVLEWKPGVFTDVQLARMQAAMRSVPSALERIDLAAERLMFEDVVQRMYSDDGRGDGWFVPNLAQLRGFLGLVEGSSAGSPRGSNAWLVASCVGALRPLAAFTVAGRRDTLEHQRALFSRLEQVPVDRPVTTLAAVRQIDAELERQSRDKVQASRWFLESLLTPALSQAIVNFAADRASREAVCAAIAAERFHRANKRWPVSAPELASFNGGVTPADPWGEGAVRMSADDAGFRIWSVGRDGKDDGGDPSSSASTNPNPRGDASGDWVWFAPRGNLDRWRS